MSTGEPFRWLIRTEGAQPTVADENEHAGTTAWRLLGPRGQVGGIARGDVLGYVAKEAVRVDQTERIYVSAPRARAVRIGIFRIGWYGDKGGHEVLVSSPLPVVSKPPCAHSFTTGLTQCAWHPTLTFVVPSALSTGVYIAKLSASTGQSDCLFVVLAARPQPLLAQLPTSTYEAYNAWGGDSLYPGGADRVRITGTTQGVEVSYQRPYETITGAGQFFARDVAMVHFLEPRRVDTRRPSKTECIFASVWQRRPLTRARRTVECAAIGVGSGATATRDPEPRHRQPATAPPPARYRATATRHRDREPTYRPGRCQMSSVPLVE